VLYALLPVVVRGLALAEPSFAGQVLGWVHPWTKESLVAFQQSNSAARSPLEFVAICVGLFLFYAGGLKLARGRQEPGLQALIFASGAAFLLINILAPVMLSSDVFNYAMYGRVWGVYSADPYNPSPPISPSDPFLPVLGREYLPSYYGPIWTLICGGVTSVGGTHLGLTVLLFRGVGILAALATAVLLWTSLRRSAPQNATRGLLLFLWNPLIVMETGLSAHNDAVMLALLLLAVWLHLRGWKVSAVLALVISALIKFLTGMLIPLYLWLVLRETKSWRERILFVGQSVAGAGLLALASFTLAHTHFGVPVSQAATAPDFYDHNFHELIFKGIRRCLGEDADSVAVPIYFQGWWLAAKTTSVLRAAPSPQSEFRHGLPSGDKVLVIAPQKTEWARVYDPASRQNGYVDTSGFQETPRPTVADTDPEVRRLSKMPLDWPTVRTANLCIRVVTWFIFAGFGLLATWRTTNFQEFVVWSAAVLIASYYLIITQIWPWYINWSIGLAALAPTRLPAKFAVILSACVLTLYITIGFQGSEPWWVYTFRSVPAFVLPASVLLLWMLRSRSHAERS
jgi:hypothetical protein